MCVSILVIVQEPGDDPVSESVTSTQSELPDPQGECVGMIQHREVEPYSHVHRGIHMLPHKSDSNSVLVCPPPSHSQVHSLSTSI